MIDICNKKNLVVGVLMRTPAQRRGRKIYLRSCSQNMALILNRRQSAQYIFLRITRQKYIHVMKLCGTWSELMQISKGLKKILQCR